MGLKADIQKGVSDGLKELGDVRRHITYISVGDSVYDAPTGENVPSVLGTYFTPVVYDVINDDELWGTVVEKGDKKALIAAYDLEVAPKVDDYITDDNVRWNVRGIRTDPVPALWILHIQRQQLPV